MFYNQTIVIDYGNDQHGTFPNQTVELFEYGDVIYGYWNDKLVAAFYESDRNYPADNTWHASR